MSDIISLLVAPLGSLLYFAYLLTGNVGWSIVIFSIVAKIVLFPLMRMAHLNSIRLLRLQPELYVIKKRYPHDKDQLNEEQYNLFQREKYSPLVGIIPLLVQLVLLMGMLQVMYDPLHHMRLPEGSDLRFLGIDLGLLPSLRNPSTELIMPFLSGIAALLFSLVQNAISPGALSQGKRTNLGLIVFTVFLSIYFAAVTPAGVGLYWAVGNLFAIITVTLLYYMYDPHKLAAEALAQKKSEQKTPAQLKQERERNKLNKSREKNEAKRFMSAKKQLVFFALTGGQYKYYKTVIDYLLAHSDIQIHYLTNDPDDAVFTNDNQQIVSYYAGHKKTISLMLKLECDILITTVPDLQTFHIKRSIAKSNIEYVHMFHAPVGTALVYKEKAFDFFDTIFCVGPHQAKELRRREEFANIKKRKLIKAGYGVYDMLLESYSRLQREREKASNSRPLVLIAPSWQSDNIIESCIDDVLFVLLNKGYTIIVRPHPQFIRLFPNRVSAMIERYNSYSNSNELVFELDFSESSSVYTADLLITDWSGIALEFSYCTSKPCIYINTPPKISNPNYKKYGFELMDFTIRSQVGISVEPIDIKKNLYEAVEKLLRGNEFSEQQIKESLSQYLYHPGKSGEAGGKYIISKLDAANSKSVQYELLGENTKT